ncbi:hypothetical protein A1O7_02058 [Cladophialophora yegresii CBS 114405]|uniref:Piwi domain-containing protein n=1 Tax=Cladophialophora yegresii CBS 114405 TaxID=1182544 RepID=W9WTG8_9EURO|nr:uncharacterized protein A1O7_02058 [Cladophialophora yegresii CBS 114405]EXJ61629.1 hypothetical protein A1O7_02058 [Cladophialophora yegresii CBS 114405]
MDSNNRDTSQPPRGSGRGRGPGGGRGDQQRSRGGSRGSSWSTNQRRGSNARIGSGQGQHFGRAGTIHQRDSSNSGYGRGQQNFQGQGNVPSLDARARPFVPGHSNPQNQTPSGPHRSSNIGLPHGPGSRQDPPNDGSGRGRGLGRGRSPAGDQRSTSYQPLGPFENRRSSAYGYQQGQQDSRGSSSYNRGRGGSWSRGSAVRQGSKTLTDGQAPQGQPQLPYGQVTHLLANYFRITVGGIRTLYQYDISIVQVDKDGKPVEEKDSGRGTQGATQQPGTTNNQGKKKRIGIPGLKKRRLIAMALQKSQQARYFGPKVAIATDYHRKLIAEARLNFLDEATQSRVEIDETHGRQCTIHIVYADEFYSREDTREPDTQEPDDRERYAVTISGPVELPLETFLGRLHPTAPRTDAAAEALKEPVLDALNVIFSYRPFQQCFRADPDVLPNMSTTNGKRFFGIPTEPRVGTTTSTGPTLADGNSSGGGGLDSVPGFARSVRAVRSTDVKLLLNVHSVTSLFYHPTRVQDLIDLWMVKHRQPRTRTDFDELADFLTNLSVRTLHHGFFHRVTELPGCHENGRRVLPTVRNTAMRPQDRERPGMTVAEYFSHHHGIQYPDDGEDTYVVTVGEEAAAQTIPADRLTVMPGQRYTNPKELPFGATRRPNDNRDRVLGTGRDIFFGNTPDTKGAVQFGFDLAKELLRVTFIQLSLPRVQYRNSFNPELLVTLPRDQGPSDGSWNLLGQHFIRTSPGPRRWTYLAIQEHNGRRFDLREGNRFQTGLQNALNDAGMSNFIFRDWPNYLLTLPDFDTFPRKRRFDKLCGSVRQKFLEFEGEVDILLVILPDQKVDTYSAVKIAGDQILGIPTVCSILKKGRFSSNGTLNKNFAANLTMKMNLKTSTTSVNHQLADRAPILTAKTMIIGIDVTHKPSTALKGAPSIAAVVGSVDDQFAQWPVSLRLNPVQDVEESEVRPEEDDDGLGKGKGKAETIDKSKRSDTTATDAPKQAREKVLELEAMVFERLLDYWEHNHDMPDQIIIYRDGLSEGQFDMCRNEELPKIKRAIENLKRHRHEGHVKKNGGDAAELPDAATAVILVCAVKRNHTRFFPADSTIKNDSVYCGGVDKEGYYNYNPRPGTLIEDGVTYGDGQDFFLISQKAIIGTARPTHYVILGNETKHTRREIAEMTHNLCFLFGRSTRSVGVCPPVYYADLAAGRARCYARKIYNAPDRRVRYDDSIHRPELQVHDNLKKKMFYV